MRRVNIGTGRRGPPRRMLVGVVVTAVLGAAAGTALATGAVSSIVGPDETINGCYKEQNGQLRVVAAGEECGPGELAIQWNRQGPKGDTGAQGIQGLKGDKGDKGDTGAPGTNGANGVDGKDGANGTNGVDGAAGAPGDPCLPTNPACVGPQGAKGDKGDAGPAGPGGGTLASLDALNGIACNAAGTPGTISVTYGPPPGGVVTLACTPSSTPTLTVVKTGAGSGTVTSDVGGISCGTMCSKSYTSGTVVTLTAASTEDLFTGWSGACSGTGTCVVTMNAAKSVSANFEPGADLSVSSSGGWIGQSCVGLVCSTTTFPRDVILRSSPGGIDCKYSNTFGTSNTGTCTYRFPTGTAVTLTHNFTSTTHDATWGGACVGATGASCALTLTGDKSVTVTYT